MKKRRLVNLLLLLGCCAGVTDAGAEEYMKRGASVDDYEQALNRVMERKRGLTTGRERQATASQAERTPSAARTSPSAHAKASAQSSTSHQSKTAQSENSRLAAAAKPAPDIYRPDRGETDASDGVSIYFGYNSAQLTNAAMSELEKLGKALTAPQFRGVDWIVEGHSDDSGSADYNQTLSEQRAQSAQRYLVEKCEIAPEKLIAVGKGESDPYDRENPSASVNRRVRLRPTGG